MRQLFRKRLASGEDSRPRVGSRRPKPPVSRRRRLLAEKLEDRRVLATYFVTTQADTSGGICVADNQAASINCSISDALLAARSNPGPDRIEIPSGVYSGLLGGFDIEDTEDVTLVGTGASREDVVIDGENTSRLFDIFVPISGVNPEIRFENLTLQNGVANDGSGGGAIVASSEVSLTIQNVVMRGNVADEDQFLTGSTSSGGAISASGDLVIRDSVFENNIATRDGGAIAAGSFAVSPTVTITDSEFTGNRAGDFDSSFGVGGALYVRGGDVSTDLTDVTFTLNEAADSGGGVYLEDAGLSASGLTVQQNRAAGDDSGGGGVYVFGTNNQTGPFSISDSSFFQNETRSGGGGLEIVNIGGTIQSSNFRLNSVTGGVLNIEGGGGIVIVADNSTTSPFISIVDTTITENTAPFGGGIAATNPNLQIRGTAITNNTVGLSGGGIAAVGDSNGGSISLLASLDAGVRTPSVVEGNIASGDGGGIAVQDVELELYDATVSGNQSGGDGGGVGMRGFLRNPVFRGDSVTIDNNRSAGDGGGVALQNAGLSWANFTVTDNQSTAGSGGGLSYDNSSTGVSRRIEFSTFASNTDPVLDSNIDASGTSIDMLATLFADGTGVYQGGFSFNSLGFNTNAANPPGLDDPTDILTFDTPLLPLADNGGLVRTRRVSSEIPEVNDRVAFFSIMSDARGVSRSSAFDSAADVGAVEFVQALVTETGGASPVDFNESDGVASVSVRLDHAVPEVVTLDVQIAPSGEVNAADLPDDVTAIPATLIVPSDSTDPQPFGVTVTQDSLVEGTETFLVSVSTASSFVDQAVSSFTASILDDDVAVLNVADVSVDESDGSVQVGVTLGQDVPGGFAVDFATLDGSATAGNDYFSDFGTLTFAGNAGEIQTVTISLQDDLLVEPTETFSLTLSNAVANASSGQAFDLTDSGLITILDDDDPIVDDLAPTVILSTGDGDGDLTVEVDAFGSFGSFALPDAANDYVEQYDPVGPLGPASAVYRSSLALRTGGSGGRQFLNFLPEAERLQATLSGDGSSATSQFIFEGINVNLQQTVSPNVNSTGDRLGAQLVQSYQFSNSSDSSVTLDLVRYLDADLFFDGSLLDGAGVTTTSDGSLILFETDAGGSSSTDTTFVGIEDAGGTAPESDRFMLEDFFLLEQRIANGVPLQDSIEGDGDGDGFVDPGNEYDVALGMRRLVTIPAGSSAVYTTTTSFGSRPDSILDPPDVSLQGHVFCDANGNGNEDAGETSVGSTVFIDLNSNGSLDAGEPTTTTNSLGDYSFDPSLPSGLQNVSLIVASGCAGVPQNFATVPSDVSIGDVVRDILLEDVNEDGVEDLVAVSERSNRLLVSSLSPSEASLSSFQLSDRPQAVDVWRPSSGPATIAVAAAGSAVAASDGSGLETRPGTVFAIRSNTVTELSMGSGPVDIVVDDFNFDGMPDYVSAASRSDEFHLLLSGTSASTVIHRALRPIAVESGDFNGDGLLDVALGSQGYRSDAGRVQFMFGDGNGGFQPGPQLDVPARLTAIAAVPLQQSSEVFESFHFDDLAVLSTQVPSNVGSPDATNDGLHSFLDSYRVSFDSSSPEVPNSDFQLNLQQRLTLDQGASKIAAGDINQDGQSDLAIVQSGARRVDLLLGDGNGNFDLVRQSTEARSPVAVALGTLSGSSDPILVVADQFVSGADSGTTLLQLRVDQRTVNVSGSVVARADFNPSTNFRRMDVNADSRVSAMDALQVINQLNSGPTPASEPIGSGRLTLALSDAADVNGDGRVTALDALTVINFLNRDGVTASAGEREPDDSSLASIDSMQDDEELRIAASDLAMAEIGKLF